jgi:acyl-CoA thioesterase-1
LKRNIIVTLAVVLHWMLACFAAQGADAPQRPVVVLGDSLSAAYGLSPEEGWVTALKERLGAQGYVYPLINASVSGETSAGGLARLPHILEAHHPSVLIIELGANDGLRGLPIDALRQNLVQMIQTGKHSGARVLLVGITLPANYGGRYKSDFDAVFSAIAHQERVSLVRSLIDGIALDDRNFQADHLHPTAAMQPRMLDNVWQELKPMLMKRPPEHR